MIRRDLIDGFLLLSQVDHAHLAGDLASAWGNDRIAGLPLADRLVRAIRDHDEGWRHWESTPTVTADGLPRQFTEMAATDATSIWTASIDLCAGGEPSMAEALRRLRSDGGEVTPDDAIVLDAIHAWRGSFNIDHLTAAIVGEGELTAEAVTASLARLEARQIVRRVPTVIGGPVAAIDLPTVGGAPLGGIWVSKHFSALAESARSGRSDSPGELAVLEAFLAEQSSRQSEWAMMARDFAGDELDRVIDTGFRYVQFFDRVSLWLCMAERHEPWQATLSSTLTLTFEPRSPREIMVEPWPFGPSALELSAPALRVPAGPLPADADLHAALQAAATTTLHWVLVPA